MPLAYRPKIEIRGYRLEIGFFVLTKKANLLSFCPISNRQPKPDNLIKQKKIIQKQPIC
jgi:hypothetical protein